jgi:hypothetical protein
MCEQCSQLQKQISRYRGFLQQRFDPLTEERIKAVIADLERSKEALHQRVNAPSAHP